MTEDGSGNETDVVTKLSPRSVAETVSRFTGMVSAKGMKLFAVIDQSAEARQVGLPLRETTLVMFGSPAAWHTGHGGVAAGRARPAAQGGGMGRRRADQSLLLRAGRDRRPSSSRR